MIRVRAAAARNINSAAEESNHKIIGKRSKKFEGIIKKEVIKVVLLDELKQNLTAYEEPLKDLRDSL